MPGIGAAIRGTDRDELFITSKVWRDHLRPADLRRSCEGSLRRLDTPYLDLLLIHWPNRSIPLDATVCGFEELREAGLIRAWGVSNFTPAHLEQLAGRDDVATNQVELHPYFRQDELVAVCRDRECHGELDRKVQGLDRLSARHRGVAEMTTPSDLIR